MTGGNRSNADHRAMAADRSETKGAARQVFESIEVVLRFGHDGLDWRSGHREQLAAQGELFLAMAIGQKTVVTDALESIGKDMNQKAADELIGGNSHQLLAVAMTIIPPLKADPAIV